MKKEMKEWLKKRKTEMQEKNCYYGETRYKGKKIYLIENAYVDNYGTDGAVCYRACGRTVDGREVRVMWLTTAEWDSHVCPDAPINEDGNKINQGCSYCEDEGNACSWDSCYDMEYVD